MRIERIPAEKPIVKNDQLNLSLLDELIKKYRFKKGNLIPLLQGAQKIYGYIAPEVFEYLHKQTGLALNDMYGVATF